MIEALRTDQDRKSMPRSAQEINQSVRGIRRGRERNALDYAHGKLTRLDIISVERLPRNGCGSNGVTPASVEVLAKPDRPVQLPTLLRNPDRSGRRPDSHPATGMRRRWQEAKDALSRGMCRVGLHRGDWNYVTEGKCSQMRECRGCESIHERTKHKREWVYTRAGSCSQVKRCLRCNISEGHRSHHPSWSNISGSRERCDRCSEVRDVSYDD